jgi:hypothetical protein
MMPLIIDYDESYTADKSLWDMLISASLRKKIGSFSSGVKAKYF